MTGEKGVQFKFGGGSKIKNNVYYMIPVLNKKINKSFEKSKAIYSKRL